MTSRDMIEGRSFVAMSVVFYDVYDYIPANASFGIRMHIYGCYIVWFGFMRFNINENVRLYLILSDLR